MALGLCPRRASLEITVIKPFIALVCALTISGQVESKDDTRPSDPLRAYTECRFDDGLEAVSVKRLPPNMQWRSVITKSGRMPVSMADGYRVMLAYPNTDYFVNLKIEASAAGRFGEDKKAIIEQMELLSSQVPGEAYPLEHTQMNRLDVFALNNPTILGGGPISFYSLFDDQHGVVMTAYILNQTPTRRKFQSIEEYRDLRDTFLSKYVACVTADRTGNR